MDGKSNSLMVIIPAYNEEGSVGDVVRSVQRVLPGTPVVVIDDGSVDGTPQMARQAGAELLRLPHHLGLGGAVQTGYKFAFEHGYDCVVRVDSDGQHNAADIPALLDKLRADGYDMVTGSRFLKPNGYRVQWLRRFGGLLFSLVLYPILGKRITDPTSGFAAVNRRALEVFSRSFPLEYPEIEALVVLQRKALRFCEVPVAMFPRQAGRSTIGSLQAMYYMVRVLLGVLVNVIKYERRFHTRRRGLPGGPGGSAKPGPPISASPQQSANPRPLAPSPSPKAGLEGVGASSQQSPADPRTGGPQAASTGAPAGASRRDPAPGAGG